MKTFKCTYRNSEGQIHDKVIEAESQDAVIERLSADDNLIISIIEDVQSSGKGRKKSKNKKVKLEDLLMFTRQLATMLDAGIPLLQCLQTLEEQAEEGQFKNTLEIVVEDLSHGLSFSEALSNHPKIFDKLYVNMVRAGEAGGFLSEILERVASYIESAYALKSKVKSAMMYPAIVMSVAVAIVILLIVKVIPVFENMFNDFNTTLPLPTRVLIGLSHFLQDWGLLLLVFLVGGVFLFRWYARTDTGRYRVDKMKFTLPVFGQLLRKVAVARFASTLAALINSGVSIIQAMEIVAETSGNEVIRRVLLESMELTEKGQPIAEAMRKSPFVPPMVCKMVEIGEATGQLDNMLERVGEFFTRQVNTAVDGLTSLIEPIMIVFLGVVVGGIMLAMFMPIFSLTTAVSG